jgi:hypothetical protein
MAYISFVLTVYILEARLSEMDHVKDRHRTKQIRKQRSIKCQEIIHELDYGQQRDFEDACTTIYIHFDYGRCSNLHGIKSNYTRFSYASEMYFSLCSRALLVCTIYQLFYFERVKICTYQISQES